MISRRRAQYNFVAPEELDADHASLRIQNDSMTSPRTRNVRETNVVHSSWMPSETAEDVSAVVEVTVLERASSPRNPRANRGRETLQQTA